MRLSLGPDKAPFDQRRLVLKSAFVHKELSRRAQERGGSTPQWERRAGRGWREMPLRATGFEVTELEGP